MIGRYTISCDKSIMDKIDLAAQKNYISRSNMIKMLLSLIHKIPDHKLNNIVNLNLLHDNQKNNTEGD